MNGSSPSINSGTNEHQNTSISQHHHHVRAESHAEASNGVVASAATNARETFLNYFFGNNKDGAMENSVIMPRATENRPSDYEKRQRRLRDNSRNVDMNSFIKDFDEAMNGVYPITFHN
jgi:hypothetical protein